jgi:hypothetical protein
VGVQENRKRTKKTEKTKNGGILPPRPPGYRKIQKNQKEQILVSAAVAARTLQSKVRNLGDYPQIDFDP